MANWYYARGGAISGPVSSGQLRQLAAGSQLQPTDLVRNDGNESWIKAGAVRGLFPQVGTPADPMEEPPPLPPVGCKAKPLRSDTGTERVPFSVTYPDASGLTETKTASVLAVTPGLPPQAGEPPPISAPGAPPESNTSFGLPSCGLGIVACFLCIAGVILTVACGSPPPTTEISSTAFERTEYRMPTWASVSACCLYGLGTLVGLVGIVAGVAGLFASSGHDGLCWAGLVISSLPTCAFACLVIAVVVGVFLALGFASIANKPEREIIFVRPPRWWE